MTSVRLTLSMACACVALTGCGTGDSDSESTPATTAADDFAMGHVHGLGVDPADDTLYVAAHGGVFRIADGEPELVAGRQQDTMGFAVVGPGHFLASGHADPRESLPPSLGLVESTDAAESWRPVSLLGEADLHSIEVAGGTVYAYDATSQTLLVTSDGQRWRPVAQLLPMLDLAVDPDAPETVYAVTDRAELLSSTAGSEPSPVYGAPPLVAVDWQPDGPLVGVGPDGAVVVSEDGDEPWDPVGTLDGPAVALDVVERRWHAATQTGVHESTDGGRTWKLVVPAS